MARLLIPLILLLIGIGGGVGAGLMMAGGEESTDAEADPDVSSDDGHGGDDAGGEGQHGADGGTVTPSGDSTEFVRLNNQFIVPIVRNGAVRSLVVMSLTVEVAAGQNSAVFNREPRLRDSFLQVMFAHANAGGFDGGFTEAAAMAPLREGLREAATAILGAVVHDVLIVDITRQDA